MQIRVPGNSQGKLQLLREIDANLAHVSRTHHMNHVRPEFPNHGRHLPLMPPERRIVKQPFVQTESQPSPRQFEMGRGFFVSQLCHRRASDAEERIPAPCCKRRQLAAGQCDTIDFRESVREERNARNLCHLEGRIAASASRAYSNRVKSMFKNRFGTAFAGFSLSRSVNWRSLPTRALCFS